MISPQMWAYVGYGILALMVIGILVISWGLYASYTKNKNTVLSLPSLDEINAVQNPDKYFESVESEKIAQSTVQNPNKAPLSRREIREMKAAPTAPKNAVSDTSSFFDEDDFKLSDGKD